MIDLLHRMAGSDPFRDLRRVQQDLDRLFGAWSGAWAERAPGAWAERAPGAWAERAAPEFPQLNLWAGEEGVIVAAELPGVAPDSLAMTVHQNTLTVAGDRADSRPAGSHPSDGPAGDRRPGGAVTALRRERPVGRFCRTVTLPFAVEAERVSARSEAGVLLVHLPRPDSDRPRRIPIATS